MTDGMMWFGPANAMQWIKAPLSGAGMGIEGRSDGGTLLNGGGYETFSFGGHRVFTYEWPIGTARDAQLLCDYVAGAYGRDLIHFIIPNTYKQNVLPFQLSHPGIAVDSEGGSLVYGVDPISVSTPSWRVKGLPAIGATYILDDTAVGFRGVEDAVFIPIPEGHVLYLGAFYGATGSGGIFASPVNTSGAISDTPVELTALANDSTDLVYDSFSGLSGVYIWVGKDASGSASVNAYGLVGRILTLAESLDAGAVAEIKSGNWMGGMGHSGVRPSGKPTVTLISAVNGGQYKYAASFREVGSWAFG